MKVRSSIRKICTKCYFVKRRGLLYVFCVYKKHKQKQS